MGEKINASAFSKPVGRAMMALDDAAERSDPFHVILELRSVIARDALWRLLADKGYVVTNTELAEQPKEGVVITEILDANNTIGLAVRSLSGGQIEGTAVRVIERPLKASDLLAVVATMRPSSIQKPSLWLAQSTGQIHIGPANQILTLTEKEGAILKLLLARAPDSVPREEFLERVWGYRADISTHTLESHIYRLRRKIVMQGGRADWIMATSGGYKCVAAPQVEKELDDVASFKETS